MGRIRSERKRGAEGECCKQRRDMRLSSHGHHMGEERRAVASKGPQRNMEAVEDCKEAWETLQDTTQTKPRRGL